MLPDGQLKRVVQEVTRLLHSGDRKSAARLALEMGHIRQNIDSDDPSVCNPPLIEMLHWLLNNDGMEEAAQLLWSPRLFDPRPRCTQDVWKFFSECSFGLLMGAASMSKSYTMGVRLLLEWVRDPEWTTVKVLGPSEQHLEDNLFSHLVALHRGSQLPLPGEVGELFIGLDRRNRVSSISGVIIPVGQAKKAGRLQGAKRKPRPTEHSTFGDLSRMFIFLDEIANIPTGVWGDIDNVMSNLDQVDTQGLKIFGAFNPTNQHDEVGKRCQPPFGWESFDIDQHYRWISVRGWEVLRLDALRCENVVEGKLIYPGLQTKVGVDRITKNSGGTNSAGYYAMVRAAFPPIGMVMSVIPQGMLVKSRGEFIWADEPEPVGGCDLALEGGSGAVYTKGLWGRASGMKRPPSVEHPKGETIMFKGPTGTVMPRWALQIDSQFVIPKGDTRKVTDSVISVSKKAGIKGRALGLDRTGHGAGVADLVKSEWSSEVQDVNYSESASDSKVMEEDTKTAKEQYGRVVSELWFALRAFMEFGYLLISPAVDMDKLSQQMTQRFFRLQGGRSLVESKADYKSRGFPSPDEADSLTLVVHAVRRFHNSPLSMKGSGEIAEEEDDWSEVRYPNGVRIDPTNRTDFLDERVGERYYDL